MATQEIISMALVKLAVRLPGSSDRIRAMLKKCAELPRGPTPKSAMGSGMRNADATTCYERGTALYFAVSDTFSAALKQKAFFPQ